MRPRRGGDFAAPPARRARYEKPARRSPVSACRSAAWVILVAVSLGLAPLFSIAGASGGAGMPPARTGLAEHLDGLFSSPDLEGAQVGVAVLDLATGRVLYERGSLRPLSLASNQKLVTTAAALDLLGRDHRFETLLLRTGSLQGATLTGNLVLRGGGDPCLDGRFDGEGDGALRRFARAVRVAGIQRVAGDVVADDRLFDRELRHPAWPRDQLDRWYCAPVSALAVNDGCVDVTVAPGARAGAPALVSLSPACALFAVENRCSTTASRREHVVDVGRRPGTHRVIVRGSILVSSEPIVTSIAVEDPALVAAAAFAARLAEEGVVLEGAVRLARPDERFPDELPVAIHASLLAQALPVVNKRSQNHYAEMLFKALGACDRSGGRTDSGAVIRPLAGAGGAPPRQGSFASGAAAVISFLLEQGIPRESFEVVDGSGLARGNRMAPRALAELLVAMARHRNSSLYLSSLAIPGLEGTLRARLRSEASAGRVLAKTGTISGVSALSGYVFSGPSPDKGAAFSILINGLRKGSARAREIEDAAVETILHHVADAAERHD